MAEELASGMACYLLREHLDVVHIVDYQVWRNLTNHNIAGRHPDYYCITSNGEALLVEVKGSITTTRSTMNQARATARIQVTNGLFGGQAQPREAGNRYIIASNLIVGTAANRRSISYIEQVAPPPIPSGGLPIADVPQPTHDPATLSFSKVLRYVGLDEPAKRITEGQPMQVDERILFRRQETIQNHNYSVLGFDPFGNVVLMDTDVIHALNEGKKPKLPGTSRKSIRDHLAKPNEKSLIMLNDSVVVHPNPEILGAKPYR